MNPWISLAVALTIAIVAFNLGMMLVGWAFRLSIEEAALFEGPAILHGKIGGVNYRLNVVPLGGHVLFRQPEFAEAPLWAAIPTMAAGPLTVFGIAVLCLSPAEAWNNFIGGFRQLVMGAVNPEEGARLLYVAADLLRTQSFVVVLGTVAAKFCVLNVLPFPSLIGGQIILRIVDRLRVGSEPVVKLLNLFGAILTLMLVIGWGAALYTALRG